MILHGLLAIIALAVSAMGGALPAKRLEVPPPNPIPNTFESIFDFVITDLEAKAVVMSDRNYVSFHVKAWPAGKVSHCFALGTTLTHSLTTIPQTWCYPAHDDSTQSSNSTINNSTTTITNSTSHKDDNPDPFTPTTEPDHIWFSWTMGDDVDPTADPTADGVLGMTKTVGAYLKVVRQVDANTRDVAFEHIGAWHLPVEGEGRWAHQVYTGPANMSLAAIRFNQVAH